MTDPNPLREDEVEAVARAIARSECSGHSDPERYADEEWDTYVNQARAAILRFDEVRGK